MHVLITGTAGFIGAALAFRLLAQGHAVTGIDNLNDYYDVNLKRARLARLEGQPRFTFAKLDIADRNATAGIFAGPRFDAVINLAAQVGVRHALVDPDAYIDANLTGFANILEGCRTQQTGHLLFASSSSVYGASIKLPSTEDDNVDH
ncbi:MAG: GDP-mannose 4,6-dehydratase, partial [Burkholderiales bacterium]|nr:GDP-mannose 4,6-dehydratase [Burkholderiales bacterium]